MISQLLATIMMALGVASGTKSTSNTFYDAEKPIQKAVETINNNYTWSEKKGSYYEYISQNNQYYTGFEKYYLKETNSTEQQTQYYQMTDIGIIYNSIYTLSSIAGNPYYYNTEVYMILKISSYTTSVTQYTLEQDITFSSTSQGNIFRTIKESTNEVFDEMLDMTVTQNLAYNLYVLKENENWTQILDTNTNQAVNDTNTHIATESPTIELGPKETKYILVYTNYRTRAANVTYSNIYGIALNINGRYVETQITQEIVDIPGVMFTVLTMPFSFISTAFDLTIFPGTPYQVNFANLFRVILATFILMWIIKKVFH